MSDFHISRIVARNFKGFDSVNIPLKKFNIIAGSDSCRSDLLQMFFFLWHVRNDDIKDVMCMQDWRGSVSNKNATLSLEYSFKADSPVWILKSYVPSHCKMIVDTITYKISINFLKNGHNMIKNEIVADFDLDRSRPNIASGTVTVGMNGVDIKPKPKPKLECKKIPKADLRHVSLLKDDTMTRFISPELSKFLSEISVYDFAYPEYLKSNSGKSERMLDRRGSNLSGVLLHIGRNPEMKKMLYGHAKKLIPGFENISVRGKLGSIKFCLETGGSGLVPANLASDRNARILALLVCIILPSRFSAIESPERDLSSETLQKISQMMAGPTGCDQLMVSTDSPEMLRRAKSGVVLAVFRDKNGKPCVSVADGRIKKLQKALESGNAKDILEVRRPVMDIMVSMSKRPPRKGSESIWDDSEIQYTMALREKIYEEQKRTGYARPFEGPVSIILYMRAPSILDVNEYGYVGDLDSFIAGVCDAIQPAHANVIKSNKKFQCPKEIYPDKPLLIEDDSQIAEIIARKTESEFLGYTLIAHPLENR